MKILLLDIETAPNTAYVWGLFKENIPLVRLMESSYILCWSAKWYGSDEIMFDSVYQSRHKTMIKRIHKLLSEADAVVHYNGSRFDIPTLNKEIIKCGMLPPAPYSQVDLLRTVRQRFRFTSNKLDHVCKELNLGEKNNTSFELWVDCMRGDADAWATMEAYNKQDVLLLEKLYVVLLPWIRNHANHALHVISGVVCPNCGSAHFHRRGSYFTRASKYQRYVCCECGTWFRGSQSSAPPIEQRVTTI